MNSEQAFVHAILAQAAYTKRASDDSRAPAADVYRNRLQDILPDDPSPDPFAFTAAAADWFTSTWDVIDIQENDAVGFAGAVYRHRASGALTVAIRGTDFSDIGFRDLLRADLVEIGLNGAAYSQTISMFNWWQRLTHARGALIDQWGLQEQTSIPSDAILISQREVNGIPLYTVAERSQIANDLGTTLGAPLVDPSALITVAGHSLGGHLAIAFGRLFSASVSHVYAYNAPGFHSNTFLDQLFNGLAGQTTAFASGRTTLIDGERGMEIVADLAVFQPILPTFRPGQAPEQIFMEDQTANLLDLGSYPGSLNHSMTVLADATALFNAFAKLDPAVTAASFLSVGERSSNIDNASLERLLDSLRRAVSVGVIPTPPAGPGAGTNTLAARNAFWTNLLTLQNAEQSPNFAALVGKLALTPLSSSRPLAATAKSDFGEFIALKTLAPFALKPKAGDTSAATALTNVWNLVHGADHTAWTADLSLTDAKRSDGLENFSDQWYQDRALMLTRLLEANEKNVTKLPARPNEPFSLVLTQVASGDDRTLDQKLTVGESPSVATDSEHVMFGSDTGDTGLALSGGRRADRIYGGYGNDYISGMDGNDHLEGNQGADVVRGGKGDDLLLGGEGIDELYGDDDDDFVYGGEGSDLRIEGGNGRDWLAGGPGNDSYYLSTTDTGVDTIYDSDNLGRLWVDGAMIGGFVAVQTNIYESTNGLYRLSVLDDSDGKRNATLFRKTDSRTIANIVDFSGSTLLGFYSLGAPPAPPPPNVTLTPRGAQSDVFRVWYGQTGGTGLPAYDSRSALVDGGGNNDVITGGSYANMEIRGGAGNDVLIDFELSNAADEARQTVTLSGGADSDFLYGSGGTMYLDGGTGNDFISSARFDSAPYFYPFSELDGSLHQWEADYSINAIADLGNLVSLTPITVNGAVGNFDTQLQRWVMNYRPFGEGTRAPTTALVGEQTTTTFNIAGDGLLGYPGVLAFLGPNYVAPVTARAVTSYQTVNITTPWGQPQATRLTASLSGAGNLSAVIAHTWSQLSGPGAAYMARDATDSLNEYAYIQAGDGEDIVWGGAGRDIVDGGLNDDRIDGAGGEDFIEGGQGNDFLVGGRHNDVLFGGAGIDILHGGGESDSLYGGAGNDVLMGDLYQATSTGELELEPSGQDFLDGGAGDDYLDGGWGDDVLFGGDDNDTLRGNAGNDVMRGGAGKDVLIGQRGTGSGNDDLLDGGEGDDTYVFESPNLIPCSDIASVDGLGETSVADASGTDVLQTNFFRFALPTQIESLQLSGFAVGAGSLTLAQYNAWGHDARARYQGNDGNNVIDASNTGQRDNFIDSVLGGVVIDGGAGADTMKGSAASTTYVVDDIGDVVIEDAAWFPGMTARDRIVTPFTTTLSINIEEAELTGGDNVSVTGNASNNLLIASTNSGSNSLAGLAGDDTYRIGANDTVVEAAGEGNDTVEIDGSANVDLRGMTFDLANYANVENLKIYKGSLGGIALLGNNGNNILYGSAGGGNLIDGKGGNDTIQDVDQSPYYDSLFLTYLETVPLNRDDRLSGGAGNDSVLSTFGNDRLDGGTGNDQLEARGSGSRTIVFGAGYGIDTVTFSGVTGSHTLAWTADTDFSTLRALRTGNTLQLSLNGGASRLDLVDYYGTDPLRRPEFNQWTFGEQQVAISRPAIDAFIAAGAPGSATSAADFLATAAAGAVVSAGGGDDVVLGAGGADTLNGDAGNDLLIGGGGNDTLNGGDGADKLDGGDGNDLLNGGLGNDEIVGGAGADVILCTSTSGQDRIKNNALQTVDGVDILRFDASVRSADVTVAADNANGIVLSVVGGSSITVEGSQRDLADKIVSQGFSWTVGDTSSTLDRVEFSDGTVWAHADLISRTSPRYGTSGNDTLIAPYGFSMTIDGLAGNDTITGRDGNDTLIGGPGYDQLQGGAGNDTLDGGDGGGWLRGEAGDDTLIGGTGDDTLDGGEGADAMSGGTGNDTYTIDDLNDVINESANAGTDTVLSYFDYVLGPSFENLNLLGTIGRRGEGNSLPNTVIGSSADDILIGGAGADRIIGGGGNDLVIGAGDGDTYVAPLLGGHVSIHNTIASGSALGTLSITDPAVIPIDLVTVRGSGAQADDLLIAFRGLPGQVTVANHFLVTAGERRNGISSLTFADGRTFDRTAIDTWINSSAGADLAAPSIYGTDLDDFLYGSTGGDRLYGQAGNDYLDGLQGDDTLIGGVKTRTMYI